MLWPRDPIICCGFHQAIEQVVDLSKCNNESIPVVRRACGGGTVLLNRDQIFYNIISHIDSNIVPRKLGEMYSVLLDPVIKTYNHFGINAVYKPVNDILVNNKKISGNGAALLEKAQVLVGNFILDFPKKQMVELLRVPNEKFRDKVFKSLEAGLSSFKDELGFIPPRDEIIDVYINNMEKSLGIELNISELEPETKELMKELKQEYLTDDWLLQVTQRGSDLINKFKVHGSLNIAQGMFKSTGGLIQVICEFQDAILSDILISGDFWIYPDTILPDLENHLKGVDIKNQNLSHYIDSFLISHNCETLGTTSNDLAKAILTAYQQISK
ncbi:MAG: lipoate--protein ligase family protein [Candidatus Hodarchaeales archaeon]